jgi:pyruvate/2-oxoacid:ferredoxin oxidoreductase alpha subunit
MDRADSYGGYGPLFMEIASAVSPHRGPLLFNKIYGLGGRDLMRDRVIEEQKLRKQARSELKNVRTN